MFLVTDLATGLGTTEEDDVHYFVHAETETEALRKVAEFLWNQEDDDKEEHYGSFEKYFDRINNTDMGPHMLRAFIAHELK